MTTMALLKKQEEILVKDICKVDEKKYLRTYYETVYDKESCLLQTFSSFFTLVNNYSGFILPQELVNFNLKCALRDKGAYDRPCFKTLDDMYESRRNAAQHIYSIVKPSVADCDKAIKEWKAGKSNPESDRYGDKAPIIHLSGKDETNREIFTQDIFVDAKLLKPIVKFFTFRDADLQLFSFGGLTSPIFFREMVQGIGAVLMPVYNDKIKKNMEKEHNHE